jgi:AraC-like DNA-binding protein
MESQERKWHHGQSDDARLWRVEVFGGLELLRARFARFTFAPHAHEEFMITVTEGGRGSPRIWGEVQRVGVGDLFVLNPGEVHSGGPAENRIWSYRGFYLPADLMRRAAQELTGVDRGVPRFGEEVANDPVVATLLRRAHLALEGPSSTLERDSLLIEALTSLVARYEVDKRLAHRVGREHGAVKLAKEYLESFPSENVSLERLAHEAGLSPFHLCRVFRRETGLSPHAYQVLVRVRLAKRLLAQGDSIAQAAMDAGFFDQAHLTRHFKRIFGVTPGHYLAQKLS